MNVRFRELTRVIYQSIVDNDCFEFEKSVRELRTQELTPFITPTYDFTTTEAKGRQFMDWLMGQQDKGVLEIKYGLQQGVPLQQPWTNAYIDTAYQRGIAEARRKMNVAGYTISQTPVGAAFNQPIHADRIGALYSRTFEDLKSVLQFSNAETRRLITEGLTTGITTGIAEGRSPRRIAQILAKDVNSRVNQIGRTRARMIARTEVIRAHHVASINEFRAYEVEGVEIEAEWNALTKVEGYGVCPECQALMGKKFTLAQIEPLLPRHPNCRCTAIPIPKGVPKPGSPVVKPRPPKPRRRKTPAPKPISIVKPPPPEPAPPPKAQPARVWRDMDNITDCELQARGMFPDKDFDFTGCDALAINPTMREFARLADRYPEAGTRIKYVGTYKDVRKWQKNTVLYTPSWGDGEWAHCATLRRRGGWSCIGLNQEYYRDAKAFAERIKSTTRYGYHPPGGNTIASVMTHEFGHAVDFWLQDEFLSSTGLIPFYKANGFGLISDTHGMYKQYWNRGTRISTYSKKDSMEQFAEIFTHVESPGYLAPDKEFIEQVKQILKDYQYYDDAKALRYAKHTNEYRHSFKRYTEIMREGDFTSGRIVQGLHQLTEQGRKLAEDYFQELAEVLGIPEKVWRK
jgi:SPP1 gp7 family putative phage head morphogenesis protein